jgi:hypothetical protein
MRLPLAILGLLLAALPAQAQDPCVDASQSEGTSSPPLRILKLGGSEATQQAETKLELELRIRLAGECLLPLHLDQPDFHQLSLADQQARLASQLPESARVLWIDPSDSEIWRVMLLTGGAPRSVLRVVEGPADPETVIDMARALADTLEGLKAVHPVLPTPAPEPAIIAVSEPIPPPRSVPSLQWQLAAIGADAIWSDAGPSTAAGAALGIERKLSGLGGLQLTLTGLGLYLWRESAHAWLRPGFGFELSGSRLQLMTPNEEPLYYPGLQGRIGLQMVMPSPRGWSPFVCGQLGLSPLDLMIHRRSDDALMLAPGPLSLHLQLGLFQNR